MSSHPSTVSNLWQPKKPESDNMNTDSEIWFAFARTFGMLFVVLAMLLVAFYLIRRFSSVKGIKGGRELIRVLAVHHLSPKEKLVLVDVMGETILIGVTPSQISRIARMQGTVDPEDLNRDSKTVFSSIFSKTLKQGNLENLMSGDGKDA